MYFFNYLRENATVGCVCFGFFVLLGGGGAGDVAVFVFEERSYLILFVADYIIG